MREKRVNLVGEIGINANGSVTVAKRLIDAAKLAGCDFVKFQKRDMDTHAPKWKGKSPRETPWGRMSYLNYKKKIEFDLDDYKEIDNYCKEKGIGWFVSVWDIASVHFIVDNFPDQSILKIPSALLIDHELGKYARAKCETLILSTGMSTEKEIEKAIQVYSPDVIMHCNSTYPSPVEELNLEYLKWLENKYGGRREYGYSGHESGINTTFAAVALGANWIERHIIWDKNMFSSDRKASLDPEELFRLGKGIREIEKAMGGQEPRSLYLGEGKAMENLRR